MQHAHSRPPQTEKPDMLEYGLPYENGEKQSLDRRLYVQLHAFTNCKNTAPIIKALESLDQKAVLYRDMNDPFGFAIVLFEENPEKLAEGFESLTRDVGFDTLSHKKEMTMLGRTYASGHEPNLEDWLLHKPIRNALNPDTPWSIWYPLRRKPIFETLERKEQGKILMEHGIIGRTYAEAGMAYDVRLSCHGLDVHDNDFVIGLIGPRLDYLSKIVQRMRKTVQTSQYLQSLGPFFVGQAIWRSEA